MQVGVNIKRRVDRMDSQKANRLRTVASLPDTAEQGDMVLLQGQLHVYTEGVWKNIDEPLRSTLKGMEARLAQLEGGDDNGSAE